MVMSKQITLVFRIDDVLMIHMLPQVVANFKKKLDKSCGQNDPLAVIRGKMYESLGMTICFRTEVKCMLTQCDSIKKF